MTSPTSGLNLIETLRWQQGQGYYLLERHLDRLEKSADELGFSCRRTDVLDLLCQAASTFAGPIERVRLLVQPDGALSLTHTAITLPDPGEIMTFSISDKTTDSTDVLYRHKTTRRQLYDLERLRLQKLTGCDEAVFTNQRGELTEGSIMSIFIEHEGVLLTPAVSCGVLPGTLRAELLAGKTGKTREAVLMLPDLAAADAIYLGNSVRGLIKAQQF